MRVFLTLPAYNEQEALPRLFQAFEQEVALAGSHDGRVVIVDDGSRDRTCEVISQWGGRLSIDLVRHASNRGLGETIRDALRRASELAATDDVIVTMDADNTHSPALIPGMIARLNQGYDLVIASRYRRGARVVGLSPVRHVMSYGARFLFQILYPISGVRDYTCGFRAYRAGLLHKAFLTYGDSLVTERGFACMAEILLKLARLGLRASEVPMVLRYDQKPSASKMNVGNTVSTTIKLIARTRFSR
jgi:dolichol-phosphate mannosyltransferase